MQSSPRKSRAVIAPGRIALGLRQQAENTRGPVSRVLSTEPERIRRRMGDHSSRTGLATGLQQSTRTTGRSSPYAVPIRSCSRWGLPCRSRYRDRGALLPHPFYLARNPEGSAGRSAFCGTVPRVAPAGRYPAPLLLGARTFLPALLRGDRPALWWKGLLGGFHRGLNPCQTFFFGSSSSSPSRCSSSRSNIALHSPSAIPSIVSGRKRRWKAVTAAGPSPTS